MITKHLILTGSLNTNRCTQYQLLRSTLTLPTAATLSRPQVSAGEGCGAAGAAPHRGHVSAASQGAEVRWPCLGIPFVLTLFFFQCVLVSCSVLLPVMVSLQPYHLNLSFIHSLLVSRRVWRCDCTSVCAVSINISSGYPQHRWIL